MRGTTAIMLVAMAGTAGADERRDRLLEAVSALPDLDPRLVGPTVDAALAVETDRIPAELLLAISWGESRFDPALRTGHVCGAMQVDPTDIRRPRSDCRRWADDVVLGMAAGVTELEMMLADRRVAGNLSRALLYRACGNRAFDGSCVKNAWPGWVLRRAERLRKASGHVRGA